MTAETRKFRPLSIADIIGITILGNFDDLQLTMDATPHWRSTTIWGSGNNPVGMDVG